MPTLEERVAALEAQTPRRLYTSIWSGEEIDRRLLNAVGRNLLDNAYWAAKEYIINQREKLVYVDNGYHIDRWTIANGIVTILDRGIRIASVSNNRAFWSQSIEGYFLFGHQVTYSILTCSGTLLTWTLTLDFPSTFPTVNTKIYTQCNGPINLEVWIIPPNGCILFQFNFSTANYAEDILVQKLEPGPVQTLAHKDAAGNWVLNDPPPDYGLELAKCQRLLFNPFYEYANNWAVVGIGNGYSSTIADIMLHHSVPMRAMPTLIYSGTFSLTPSNISGADIGLTEMSIISPTCSASITTLRCTVDSGLTIGSTYTLRRKNNAAAKLLLSAEP